MRRIPLLLALALTPPTFAAEPVTRNPEVAMATAAQVREQALADGHGYAIVESLTTEVGARLAGSEADARAVA